MVPPVVLQNLLVTPRERPGRLRLPEDPGARPNEVVVEQALVEAPRVALPVYAVQGLPALFDPLEPVARLGLLGLAHVLLQRVPGHPRLRRLVQALGLHPVVGGEEGGVVDGCDALHSTAFGPWMGFKYSWRVYSQENAPAVGEGAGYIVVYRVQARDHPKQRAVVMGAK